MRPIRYAPASHLRRIFAAFYHRSGARHRPQRQACLACDFEGRFTTSDFLPLLQPPFRAPVSCRVVSCRRRTQNEPPRPSSRPRSLAPCPRPNVPSLQAPRSLHAATQTHLLPILFTCITTSRWRSVYTPFTSIEATAAMTTIKMLLTL
jgi:hypothetical protein